MKSGGGGKKEVKEEEEEEGSLCRKHRDKAPTGPEYTVNRLV